LVVSGVGIVLLPYFALRVMLCFETMMLEGVGPWAAIRSSWRITRGRLLRLLGVVLLSTSIVIVPFFAVELLGLVRVGGHTSQAIIVSAGIVLQGILLVPLVSFLTAATTLFYLQSRSSTDARPAA